MAILYSPYAVTRARESCVSLTLSLIFHTRSPGSYWFYLQNMLLMPPLSSPPTTTVIYYTCSFSHHSKGFPIFFFSCLSFTTLASKHQQYYFPCWILFCSQLFLQNESQSLTLALKSPSSGSSSFISWHNSTHSMLWPNQTTYTFWPQHVLPSPGACSPTLLACRTPIHLMASGCEALPDPPKHNYSSCPLRHCGTITVTGFLTAGVSNHLFAWVFPADWIPL